MHGPRLHLPKLFDSLGQDALRSAIDSSIRSALQDRLVKELRLAEISDMSAGNAFLPAFMKQYNEKFSIAAVKAENLHRTLNVQASRLADILCHREQRHVSQQLSLAYDRRQIILERSEVAYIKAHLGL